MMNITYGLDLSKSNIASFSELVLAVLEQLMKIGQEIVSGVPRQRDMEPLMERDASRFRCKGLRATSVKTRLGVIEFQRRVYTDANAEGGKRRVFLLDEDMNIDAVGLVEKELCQQAATLDCMTSCRNTAEISCAVSVSAKGLWNIVQALGEKEAERVERYAELAEQSAGTGTPAAPILYGENDGVWLKLQGEDRKKYRADKEMKVGIAYDGVTWDAAKTRRELHNKVAYASFEDAKAFKNHKEGVVSHCFDVETVKLRVVNGDGRNGFKRTIRKTPLPY